MSEEPVVEAGTVIGREDVFVVLPPLASTFALPTREQLLALKAGDGVKLIFQDREGAAERMWVKLTELRDATQWHGVLDNDPVLLHLRAGEAVRFHPLAVIDTKPQPSSGLRQPGANGITPTTTTV